MVQTHRTRTHARLALLVLGLCAGVLAAPAAARRSREAPPRQSAPVEPAPGAPEVSLGKGKVVRGETVYLSLVVFQDEVKVVKSDSEITFPNATVSFEGFDRIGDQDPLLKIDAEVVPRSRGQEQGVLKVQVASGRGAPLPEGPLVKLKFRISPETPGGTLRLKHSAQALTVAGQTIVADARDADVSVAEEAVYSCFFYMH